MSRQRAKAAEPVAEPVEEAGDLTEEKRAQRVLDEIRAKSSEIVVKAGFRKAIAPGQPALVDRLDDTLGIDGWQVEFFMFGTTAAQCKLSVRIDGKWVSKCGVGVASDAISSPGLRIAATLNEAFLSAASLFGIGREHAPTARENAAAAATAKEDPPKKKEETADDRKAKTGELKKFWTVKICECNTPAALNKLLKGGEVKSIPDYAKRDVFNHIQEQAKAAGWLYDTDDKSFYEAPAEEGNDNDAIPF